MRTRPLAGRLGDRLGHRRVFLPCLGLISAGLACLAFAAVVRRWPERVRGVPMWVGCLALGACFLALAVLEARAKALGERGAGGLLILSQVILSLQLSFAVVPLVYFTSERRKMGSFVNSPLLAGAAWSVAAVIVGLNVWLLIGTFREWLS